MTINCFNISVSFQQRCKRIIFSLPKIQTGKKSSGFVTQFITMVTHRNNFAKSIPTVVLLTLKKTKQKKNNIHSPTPLLPISFKLCMKEPEIPTLGSNSVK